MYAMFQLVSHVNLIFVSKEKKEKKKNELLFVTMSDVSSVHVKVAEVGYICCEFWAPFRGGCLRTGSFG